MKELALNLPYYNNIANTPGLNSGGELPNQTLGGLITSLLPVALYFGAFMMFVWIIWGAFQYILAEGNKERLAHARSRIRWAIIGFIILLLSIFAGETFRSYIQPKQPPLKDITAPCLPGQTIDPGSGLCK